MSPSSNAARPGAVIQGLTVVLAQTASTARPARTEDARDLGRDPFHVGHEHDPEAAEDAVDGIVREREMRGVLDAEADTGQSELCRPSPRRLDHLGSAVGGDQLAARLDPGEHPESRLAGPGGELEDAVSRLRVEELDHPLRELGRCACEEVAAALPARRDASPPLELLGGVVRYAVTPLNRGMMCSP